MQIQFGNGQTQCENLFFCSINVAFLKIVKLPNRCAHRTFKLANVELRHLHSPSFTIVAHHESQFNGVFFVGCTVRKLQCTIVERGVRKTISKGVSRVGVGKYVVATWLFSRSFFVVITLVCGQSIIINRQLAHAFRERHGQTPRWRELAKKHSGQRKASLFATIPLHNECANTLSEALCYQRPTSNQHNH